MVDEEVKTEHEADTLEMAVRIVSAYVGNNPVPADQVPNIQDSSRAE